MTEPLENLYFNWLYSQVCNPDSRRQSEHYIKLFCLMHQTEFLYKIPGDDNRAEDGRDLRPEFLREEFIKDDGLFSSQGCSVLEMLIALSRRASFATDESSSVWFWIMLDNLGLSGFHDGRRFDRRHVQAVLDNLIYRTYNSYGLGGLFPLLRTNRDQTKVEIWYQFNEYLFEHES